MQLKKLRGLSREMISVTIYLQHSSIDRISDQESLSNENIKTLFGKDKKYKNVQRNGEWPQSQWKT